MQENLPLKSTSYPNPAFSLRSLQRTFGRSLLNAAIGNFFTDRNNAASLIALMLVYSICTIVVRDQKYEYVDGLLNIVFVVIGYYFGAKRDIEPQGDEKP